MTDVVKDILAGLFPNWSVEALETSVSDIIISDREGELKFVAKLFERGAYTPIRMTNFIRELSAVVRNQGVARIPMTAMVVDRRLGTIDFAMLVDWTYSMPLVCVDPNYIPLNNENKDRIYSKLLESDQEIRVLPVKSFRVVKTIRVLQNNQWFEIVYLRNFTPSYKMRKDQNLLTEDEKMDRMLHGVPEDDYPSDELDELIMSAFVKKYSQVKLKTTSLLLNTELRDLRRCYANRECGTLNLLFVPRYENLVNFDGQKIWGVEVTLYPLFGEMLPSYMRYDTLEVEVPQANIRDYRKLAEDIKEILSIKKILS